MPDLWSRAGALALLLIPAAVGAESVTINARQPARFAEPSMLRKMVVGSFGGRGGPLLASALQQALMAPGPDGTPYFTLVAGGGGGAGVGVLSGNVGIEVSHNDSTQQRSR